MRKAFICLLLCWFTGFPFAGYPQKSFLAINSINLPEQIADNNIQLAIQDEASLLWFVTENGLYRFDGTELLHFGIGTKPALPSLSITALCTDNQGNLWIGFNNGAARFDLKHWSISAVYSPNWNSLNPHDKKITAAACLSDGDVYFGTQSGKLFTVKHNNLIQVTDLGAGRRRFMPTGPPLEEPAIENIQEPVKGQIWCTTEDGALVSINKTKNAYNKPIVYKFATTVGMSITNICYDSSGKCIFSVGNLGIFRSDTKQLYREKRIDSHGTASNFYSNVIEPVPIPDSIQANNYSHFFYVPGGQVGLITMGKGLSRYIYMYDFFTNKWRRNAQCYFAKYPGELIHSITSLASGKVAYLNSGGGLSAIHAGLLPFDMKLNSSENINSIRAIYGHGDSLYIGSYQHYFLRFNKATGKVTPLKTLYVYSILPWGKDSLLIGSEGGGLNWYKPSTNQLSPIGTKLDLTQVASVYQSQYITVLCRVNKHLLLEGTTRGIHLIDPINKKLYPVFSNPSAQNMQGVKINAITPYPFDHSSAKTKYLVGTDAGAFIVNIKKGQTSYLIDDPVAEEIRQSKVHSFLTSNRQIWIGTSGLGMLAVDSAGKLHYMEWLNSKLTGQIIYSLIKSGTHILIGTNKGLNILDLKDSSLASYQSSDGMPSDEFNQAASFQDVQEVYFGTLNGIIWWNKKKASLSKKSLPLAIHINKFTIADKNNHLKTTYRLAYLSSDSCDIQIPANTRYFSIIFDNPEEHNKMATYYYRLGPTETWVNLGSRREITFNKMPPGSYDLQLTRHLQDKATAAAIFQIPITILPAYYQTVWFKILVLLIIAGIIILLVRIRQNQLNKVHNLRTKIAGDLHDEIGSSLTRIWHQAQRLQPDSINRSFLEQKLVEDKKLQHIAATSQEAIAMLSDMVWSIDAQFDTFDELIVRMKTYVYQLQNEFDILVKMTTANVSKEKKVSQIIRQNLLLLFKEGINNAIKYGNSSVINITIDIDTKITMEIINTFNREVKRNGVIGGRGIANMQRRVKNMNGELKIEKEENRFTLLIIV